MLNELIFTKMKKIFFIWIFLSLFSSIRLFPQTIIDNEKEIILSDKIMPLTEDNIFRDPDYYNWCSSIIKGNDEKYHLFYSCWEKSKTFSAWLTHSKVAHAVSEFHGGPYRYVNTILDFDKEVHKKGELITAHNPKIKCFNGKYYLYFISTTLDCEITDKELTEIAMGRPHPLSKSLRNNQRTYVASSDVLDGKWMIRKKPLLKPGGPIVTLVTNPAITQGPDKRFYLIVKGDKPGTTKFLRNQAVAVSNYPDRGFKLQTRPVIEDWDTEDISMWYDSISNRFYAIFHAHVYLGLMSSKDGINWNKASDFKIIEKKIEQVDKNKSHRQYVIEQIGREPIRTHSLQRPFVFVENGQPRVLSAAVGVGNDAYIVMIPLKNFGKKVSDISKQ